MGMDHGSFPRMVVQRLYKSLMSKDFADADNICRKETGKTTLSGTIYAESSKSGLARIGNKKLPPLVAAKKRHGKLASRNYDAGACVGATQISDEAMIDYDALGEDVLANKIKECRAEANVNVNAVMVDAIESTVLNNEFDATTDGDGAWDDYTNSHPYKQMQEIVTDVAPGSDTVIVGLSMSHTLLSHPDTFAETSNFAAGLADYNALVAYIKRKVPGIANVYILDVLYDAAEEGEEPDIQHLFTNGCWIGHKSDLVLVDPQHAVQSQVDVTRNADQRCWDVQIARYIDVVRISKELGCAVTNIKTP